MVNKWLDCWACWFLHDKPLLVEELRPSVKEYRSPATESVVKPERSRCGIAVGNLFGSGSIRDI